MSSTSLVVRLPAGTEYWYASNPPEIGDTIVKNGNRFVVVACEVDSDGRVILTLEETSPAAS